MTSHDLPGSNKTEVNGSRPLAPTILSNSFKNGSFWFSYLQNFFSLILMLVRARYRFI
jgi:hypothetical protein